MSANKEGLDLNAPCRGSRNFSFEWNCPLDALGKPFRVGYRICKNADCLTEAHITQSRFIAKQYYGDKLPKIYARSFSVIPVEKDLLQKLAKPVDRDRAPKTCQVPECKRPHRGLNLCGPHHNQLYRERQKQSKPSRIKQDNSDIEQYMLPPLGNDLKVNQRYCHYPNCDRDFFARGLCKTHHKRWLRWKKQLGVKTE